MPMIVTHFINFRFCRAVAVTELDRGKEGKGNAEYVILQ